MTTSYPAAAAPHQSTVKQPNIIERLSPELQSELLLHLQPRLVGRLTRTCQWFRKLCRSRAYWERVAFHMLYRGERLSIELNSLYYLSMLDGGYKRAMERFIALVYGHPKDSGQHATAFLPRAGESLRENTARVVSTTLSEYEDPEHPYRCPRVAPLYREEMLPSANEPRELCRKIVEQTVHTRLRIREMELDVPYQHGIFFHPAETGFVTRDRRAVASGARLIQSLDDDSGMDVASKRRVFQYVRRFMDDMTERRVRTHHHGIQFHVTEIEEDTCLTLVPFYFGEDNVDDGTF